MLLCLRLKYGKEYGRVALILLYQSVANDP